MTNREKYKQAFSVLHAPDDLFWEAEKMERKAKRYRWKTMASVVAVCVMLAGSITVAYAANVGGIQRTIQIWLHGEQTAATIQFDGDGSYRMEYTDEEGNTQERGGGGIAFAQDGTEIPVTEEELMAQLDDPEVVYQEDGSVMVYWFDQALDITDQFENGVCYVKLANGEKTLYLTVEYGNGYKWAYDRCE